MGQLIEVLSIEAQEEHTDIKGAPGSEANITAPLFSASGEDSPPLEGDTAMASPIEGSGASVAVGFLDPKNKQKAQPGEKRIYARDENGEEIAEIWIKRTGEITLVGPVATLTMAPSGSILAENALGSIELKDSGEVEANGATITLLGDVVSAANVSLNLHTHISNGPTLPTGPAIPTP